MKATIVGGSGYVGGELLRLLLHHPEVQIAQVTSERFAGKPVGKAHPNLRKHSKDVFCSADDLHETDLLFAALPHGEFAARFEHFNKLAPRVIDLSADFRLRNPEDYKTWYGFEHPRPAMLDKFVYGIVELHREKMREAKYVSSAGCNATATILGLFPLARERLIDLSKPIITEAKCGSSEGGNKVTESSHHPERSGSVRSYKPTGHRHTAEMVQELGTGVHFSATAIEMVRGILATSHVFVKEEVTELEIWEAFRKAYGSEPFIRMIKEKTGIYRYPEPKILSGTNFCDIGFELDGRRLVVMSAIDNLMKGAAGQAVHAMNVMCGYRETAGLEFMGLHPI